ncbi:MAG TPA: polynucleotide adenylyltransferase, partial [Bacillota bacterium]|nr:polynucleotide adenylyltransferase [Bacillota bacterium]
DMHIKADAKSVRKAMSRVGDDMFESLLKVIEADKKAQNPGLLKERTGKFIKIWELYKDIKEKGQCTSLKSLAVNGDDLIALGIKPGKKIKELLNSLLEKVIEEPELNKKEILLSLISQHHRAE